MLTADAQVERTLAALLKARNEVAATAEKPVSTESRPKWRVYEDTYEVDPELLRRTLSDLDDQIIELERAAYRDPEQDAEMRAEMYAEMAITGVRDDPALYMHTPHEERLFQERIAHEVNYGYYDSDGYWEDGIYADVPCTVICPACGANEQSDEFFTVDGHDVCHQCSTEAIIFMNLLGVLTNTEVESNRWETEFNFVTEDEDED